MTVSRDGSAEIIAGETHDDDPGAGYLDLVGALAVTVMALGTIAMVTRPAPWSAPPRPHHPYKTAC